MSVHCFSATIAVHLKSLKVAKCSVENRTDLLPRYS